MSLGTRASPGATALIGVAALFLLASPPTDAQSSSPCTFEPAATPDEHRVVDFDVTPTTLQFTSRSQDANDVLRGSFDLDTATLQMQGQRGDGAPVRLIVEYASVVEFRDVDGDARLGFSDQIVRELTLADATGATLHSVPRMQPGSYEAIARYPLNASSLLPGVAELRFVVLSEPTTFAGEEHGPGRAVLEASVERFPFERNDTRLALKVRQTGGPNLSASSDEIVSEGRDGSLSYRWSRCAARDGTVVPVGALVMEYPSGANPRTTTAFALPHGDRTEHLSSVGFAPAPVGSEGFDVASVLPSGNGFLFGASALGAAMLIGLTAWRRVRSG